jgi:undecaprenyl-diphosphatase
VTWWQAVWLGVVQGATEFLPVSSSGHLVIVPYLLGWPDPGLTLDAILHLGTLMAVLGYFWKDLWRLAQGAWRGVRGQAADDPDARLAWAIVVGTVPAAVIGFLLEDVVERLFEAPRAAAAFLLVTAALLVLSEVVGRRERPLAAMSWTHALGIGLAQTLAIAPGISRSGSTIAAGLLLGYRREDATRFSFLLSVPIVLGSGMYQLLKLMSQGMGRVTALAVVGGFVAAALTGYLAIVALLALVRRRGLWPFAVYCAALGLLVLTGVLG